jgi:hypothetical protein
MSDDAPHVPSRLEHRLDQLIWRLARIEGDLTDLRRALNAFRADIAPMRAQAQSDPDAA